MSGREHIHTLGLQQWGLLGKLHVCRKAEMEFGIKCWMPTLVPFGLNTLSNTFLTRFSRYCFSYQMLHLCSLVLEIIFNLAWKTMRLQMPRTPIAWETQNLWDLLPIAVSSIIPLPQRAPDEKYDSTVSFFTFPVHISHWTLPTMKVPNYSLSTFSFSLLSTLKSHTPYTIFKIQRDFFSL